MEKDKYLKLQEAYHDKVYAKTNKLDGIFKNVCRMYDRMYGNIMPTNREAKILDLACGAGQFVKYCDNEGYTNITGVDLSPRQVEYCQTAIEFQSGKIKFVNSEVFDFLESRKDEFDLIVANDFIEHLTKDKGIELVGLVAEALKPGGRLILKTGNMAAFGGIVIWCNGLDHECGYTEKSLRSLLAIWDFEEIEIIPYYGGLKKQKRLLDIFFYFQRLMFRYIYAGDYPKVYTKIIAVTGIKSC